MVRTLSVDALGSQMVGDDLPCCIPQESTPLPNQHQQPTSALMIMLMELEMLSELDNTMRQPNNLNICRTGVCHL